MSDDFIFQHPHKVIEKVIDGQRIFGLELTETPYQGIIFSYGGVSFKEDVDQDKLTISFEYDIHRDINSPYDKKEFEQYIGDLLQELIMYGIHKNDIVYTGGTDDNREDNSQQSDSQ